MYEDSEETNNLEQLKESTKLLVEHFNSQLVKQITNSVLKNLDVESGKILVQYIVDYICNNIRNLSIEQFKPFIQKALEKALNDPAIQKLIDETVKKSVEKNIQHYVERCLDRKQPHEKTPLDLLVEQSLNRPSVVESITKHFESTLGAELTNKVKEKFAKFLASPSRMI